MTGFHLKEFFPDKTDKGIEGYQEGMVFCLSKFTTMERFVEAMNTEIYKLKSGDSGIYNELVEIIDNDPNRLCYQKAEGYRAAIYKAASLYASSYPGFYGGLLWIVTGETPENPFQKKTEVKTK